MKRLLLIPILVFALSARAQLIINEIMQSNIDCIVDDLNDFPDSWVELYNNSYDKTNLNQYSLGITTDPSKAWPLPDKLLGAMQYVLVYCDKVGEGWHTHFRLESGKDCQLYLFRNGEIIDRLPSGMKKQPAPNISYGRAGDASQNWGYMLEPTPGLRNKSAVVSNKDILESPIFSVPGKILSYGETLNIELSMPNGTPEGTEIRYTTDGSEPTANSALYRPMTPVKVTGNTVIRAKPFCDGYLSPRSTTHSYLMMDREVTLPVISVVTDPEYLYDDKFGIYVEGTYYPDKKNYEYNWRRPANFEYFDGDLEHSVINQLGETRITGAASRGSALKSLGIYANKRFGEKRFKYEFFPDQRPGITDYKSLMLRNAGNDFDYLYMRDAIIQRVMSSYVDLDWQAWSPAIFFLNGEYKGMLNIRERSNEDNIYSNYNGLEDIDMIENWWELKEGNWQPWQEFKDFYNEHGHTWEEYDRILDVEEFLNVMIMNLFFCNLDFPGNNIVFWRPQTEGGRWRVIVKDTDFGLGLYGRDVGFNTIEWINNPGYDSSVAWANQWDHTRLFRRLMEDERFKREFIDRFAIYMGDFLNFDRAWEIWEPMYDRISFEYPHHRELFNRWWPNYTEEITGAKNWLRERPNRMYTILKNYYHLGEPRQLIVNMSLTDTERKEIAATINGVTLSRGGYTGKFFAGRTVTLAGEGVAGWSVSEIYNNSTKTYEVNSPVYSFTMPTNCNALIVNAITPINSLGTLNTDSCDPVYYDMMGIPHSAPVKGLNIVRSPSGTEKFINR